MRMLNLNKLIEVKVNDFCKSRWYLYIEKSNKKNFWRKNYKAGIYINMMGLNYVGKVPENHLLIDNVVYEKPEVVMTFENNITQVRYFDTLEDAKLYAEKYTLGKNWLKTKGRFN